MDFFHDRRDTSYLPSAEDYERPLTRAELAKANKRFRQSGVPRRVGTDREMADRIVKVATRSRRQGQDFNSVGEYLEFLNGMEIV